MSDTLAAVLSPLTTALVFFGVAEENTLVVVVLGGAVDGRRCCCWFGLCGMEHRGEATPDPPADFESADDAAGVPIIPPHPPGACSDPGGVVANGSRDEVGSV